MYVCMSMYACMFIWVCMHVYTNVYTCILVWVCIHACVHKCVCVYVCMSVYVCVSVRLCTPVCMSEYTCVSVRLCTPVCMSVYTCTVCSSALVTDFGLLTGAKSFVIYKMNLFANIKLFASELAELESQSRQFPLEICRLGKFHMNSKHWWRGNPLGSISFPALSKANSFIYKVNSMCEYHPFTQHVAYSCALNVFFTVVQDSKRIPFARALDCGK